MKYLSLLGSEMKTPHKKIDIYNQILINWNKFVDYVWSFRDKSEEKIHNKKE